MRIVLGGVVGLTPRRVDISRRWLLDFLVAQLTTPASVLPPRDSFTATCDHQEPGKGPNTPEGPLLKADVCTVPPARCRRFTTGTRRSLHLGGQDMEKHVHGLRCSQQLPNSLQGKLPMFHGAHDRRVAQVHRDLTSGIKTIRTNCPFQVLLRHFVPIQTVIGAGLFKTDLLLIRAWWTPFLSRSDNVGAYSAPDPVSSADPGLLGRLRSIAWASGNVGRRALLAPTDDINPDATAGGVALLDELGVGATAAPAAVDTVNIAGGFNNLADPSPGAGTIKGLIEFSWSSRTGGPWVCETRRCSCWCCDCCGCSCSWCSWLRCWRFECHGGEAGASGDTDGGSASCGGSPAMFRSWQTDIGTTLQYATENVSPMVMIIVTNSSSYHGELIACLIHLLAAPPTRICVTVSAKKCCSSASAFEIDVYDVEDYLSRSHALASWWA